MALLFSAVTVTAGNKEVEFLVGGIPREYDDLEGWTAFDDLMEDTDAETEVSVHAEAYLLGFGETYKAAPEDIAYIIAEQTEQLKRRIQAIRESESNSEATEQRLQEMQEIIDSRNANHDTYDDSIVRQMIECIKVGEEGKLRIIFGGGYEIEEHI